MARLYSDIFSSVLASSVLACCFSCSLLFVSQTFTPLALAETAASEEVTEMSDAERTELREELRSIEQEQEKEKKSGQGFNQILNELLALQRGMNVHIFNGQRSYRNRNRNSPRNRRYRARQLKYKRSIRPKLGSGKFRKRSRVKSSWRSSRLSSETPRDPRFMVLSIVPKNYRPRKLSTPCKYPNINIKI